MELKLHDKNSYKLFQSLGKCEIFFKPYQLVKERKPGWKNLHRSLILVHFSVIVLNGRLKKLCSLELKLSLV